MFSLFSAKTSPFTQRMEAGMTEIDLALVHRVSRNRMVWQPWFLHEETLISTEPDLQRPFSLKDD